MDEAKVADEIDRALFGAMDTASHVAWRCHGRERAAWFALSEAISRARNKLLPLMGEEDRETARRA